MRLTMTRGTLMLAAMLATAQSVHAGDVAAFSPVPLPANTKATTDRLAGRTVVEMRPFGLFKDGGRFSAYVDIQPSAFFFCDGDTVSAPDSISIMFVHGAKVRGGVSSEAADWWFPESSPHSLRVLSDDIRIDLGTMRYLRAQVANLFLEENRLAGEPGLNTMAEVLTITLPTDRVLYLFGAASTEGQVDGMRFFLHNKAGGNDQRYRNFAGYVRSLRQVKP